MLRTTILSFTFVSCFYYSTVFASDAADAEKQKLHQQQLHQQIEKNRQEITNLDAENARLAEDLSRLEHQTRVLMDKIKQLQNKKE